MECEQKCGSFGSSHFCYLLTSEAKKKASYIGYSLNPCRRLRQHNGEIKNGAKKTKSGTPWEIGVCVGGFPDRISALRFEWAWQHPNICRATRDYMIPWKIVKKKAKSDDKVSTKTILNKRQWSIQQRIWILVCIVTLTPWKEMNLNVYVLSNNIENIIVEYISKLGKIQNDYKITNITVNSLLMFTYNGSDCNYEHGTKFLKCDYNTFKDIQNSSFNRSHETASYIQDNSAYFSLEEERNIGNTCTICQQKIENNRKYIMFPCCDGMNIHVSCIQPWGEYYKANSENSLLDVSAPLIPEKVSCPCCFQTYMWSEVKSRHIMGLESRNEREVENRDIEDSVVSDSLMNSKELTDSNIFDKRNANMGLKVEMDGKNSLIDDVYLQCSGIGDADKSGNMGHNHLNITDLSCDKFSSHSENEEDINEMSQRCEFIDLTVDSE
ncbi:hypothetical protein FG386_002413 [Cryptosporidium ryanae]|uniref:uncharacterized protein n=1 Tax=Cryptosporidium ryanae TaxID=515981 RepID=UPI00351A5822|nr:hypothetical protein FG386_002413 [Cryptosporidium ryanae]